MLDRDADGIVVLTGGTSRVTDALELLPAARGKRLLITGVNPGTTTTDIARQAAGYDRLLGCCVDLDYSAINTLGNAVEARRWAIDRGFHSLIIVTSSYHMPRALAEIAHQLPDVALIPFPVVSDRLRVEPWWSNGATTRLVLSEYFKYLYAHVRMRFDSVAAATGQPTALPMPAAEADSSKPGPALSSSSSFLARSIVFNASFYVNITVRMIVALPTILLPYSFLLAVLRAYASSTLWLLRVVCGVTVEWRGREKLPGGAYLVACKHQSLWETFALFSLLPDPTYVLKRELMWLPLFGWLARKARMIPIDRGAHATALARMAAAARAEIARGRQIVIFPGGNAAAAGCKAALSARRRLSLCRNRPSMRADGAQFRIVLAAPLAAPLSGHRAGRSARSDTAGPRGREFLTRCRTRWRKRPLVSSRRDGIRVQDLGFRNSDLGFVRSPYRPLIPDPRRSAMRCRSVSR